MASVSCCATNWRTVPVVLAFFKVSCPICQYAFPFLERLERAYGHQGVRLIGVSQDDPKHTAAFTKEFGVTFPVLLDDRDTYPVSNAYGLTNVPSIFWIAQDGKIEVSSVGWVKADFTEISRKMAESGKIPPRHRVQARRRRARFPRRLKLEELIPRSRAEEFDHQ